MLERGVGRAYGNHHFTTPLVWLPVTRPLVSPLTIFSFPSPLHQHTPTGCPRGDPQILRNLHLHEHFQRANIKAGRRDRLKSHRT